MPPAKSQTQSSKPKGRFLLSIESIPSAIQSFPAYFVGSTAPNNVEDLVKEVPNPEDEIKNIAGYLCAQEKPQLLITVHGYNTGLGEFAAVDYFNTDAAPTNKTAKSPKQDKGVKPWYQEIRTHIEENCAQAAEGLVFVGYRWPSELVNGSG